METIVLAMEGIAFLSLAVLAFLIDKRHRAHELLKLLPLGVFGGIIIMASIIATDSMTKYSHGNSLVMHAAFHLLMVCLVAFSYFRLRALLQRSRHYQTIKNVLFTCIVSETLALIVWSLSLL